MRGIWKSSIGEVLTVVSSAPRVREGVRGALRGVFWLLRVQLDDELLLHWRRDLTALGLAQHLGGERVVVGLQPRGHLGGELGRVADELVVEAALEQREQVLAGDPGLARGLLVVVAELLLEHAVVAACLLLLAQLHAGLGLLLAPAAVVSRRVPP